MDKMDYIQAASLVKMQEKKMFDLPKITRMIEAKTAKSILKILSETEYNQSMIGITKEEEYKEILKNEIQRVYKFAREISKKEQKIVDMLALKYAYQDLKTKFKEKLKNENDEKNLLNIELYEEKAKVKEASILALKEYEKTKDIQKVLFLLDKLYLNHISEVAKELEFPIFSDYAISRIDAYNIISFLRMKKQKKDEEFASEVFVDGGSFELEELLKLYNKEEYINEFKKKFEFVKNWDLYEKTKDISQIEKSFDNRVMEIARNYKNVNYGPEPIFTYILAKEYEISAIRLIMIGKINKIEEDVLKERIRDIYV